VPTSELLASAIVSVHVYYCTTSHCHQYDCKLRAVGVYVRLCVCVSLSVCGNALSLSLHQDNSDVCSLENAVGGKMPKRLTSLIGQ